MKYLQNLYIVIRQNSPSSLEWLYGYLLLSQKLWDKPEDFSNSWNFGPNDENFQTVGDIIKYVENYYNRGIELSTVKKKGSHEANLLQLNSLKAKKKLRWEPKLNWMDALDFTLEWYKKYYENDRIYDFTRKQIVAYNK